MTVCKQRGSFAALFTTRGESLLNPPDYTIHGEPSHHTGNCCAVPPSTIFITAHPSSFTAVAADVRLIFCLHAGWKRNVHPLERSAQY